MIERGVMPALPLRVRAFGAWLALSLCLPAAAWAGPPFETDDPEPPPTGGWEVYAPIVSWEGRGRAFEGEAAAEFNYGAVRNLQLNVEIPVAFRHDERHASGLGDVHLGVKYRFVRDEAAGVSVAFYPSLTLPTGTNGFGNGHATAFLPLWAQKQAGAWTIFGGGGYTINPGEGNRDFWSGGVAVTRDLSERLQLGVEATRAGAEEVGADGRTSLGVGMTWEFQPHLALVASGGPTFFDGDGAAAYHAYTALRVEF